MSRSRYLTALLVITLLTAGCISGGPGGGAPTATDDGEAGPTTEGPVADETPTAISETDGERDSDDETATPPSWEHAAEQPDHDKTVFVENHWSENATLDVQVIRNTTGETVHDGSYEIEPGQEREVYHLDRADPDGIERFTVVVSARNGTESVTIETSACYGNIGGTVGETGDLNVFYAVC